MSYWAEGGGYRNWRKLLGFSAYGLDGWYLEVHVNHFKFFRLVSFKLSVGHYCMLLLFTGSV